jgi:hypothetical protein
LAARETPAAVEEKRTADAELQRLEAALPIARQRVVDAANRAHQAQRTKPRGKLERQLRDSADPRIRDWRYYMEALANAASANFRTAASVQLTVFGSRLVTTTNADDVQRVRSILAECIATTHRLELQPLSYAEVSESLGEMGHRLQGPLSKLGLNPPQLATDGEVGPPMPWPMAGPRPGAWTRSTNPGARRWKRSSHELPLARGLAHLAHLAGRGRVPTGRQPDGLHRRLRWREAPCLAVRPGSHGHRAA